MTQNKKTPRKAPSQKVAANAKKRSLKVSRYLVFVLGMHRSGTSTLAGVLHHLGCTLPRTPMPASKDNPKGYFESLPISKLNDRILTDAGSQWRDWTRLSAGWLASPMGKATVPEIADLVRDEYGKTPIGVLKEPRICRMVPLWNDGIDGAGFISLPVLIHRNPAEVAKSLQARDHIDLSEGYMLWLRHVLDAEAATRGTSRFITNYDLILADWRGEMARLQKKLSLSLPGIDNLRRARAIDDFLSPQLRHFVESPEKLSRDDTVPDWVGTTYEIMERWARNGEVKADHKTLDRITAELEAVTPLFHAMIDSGKQQVRSLKARVSELGAAHEEAQQQITQREADAEDSQSEQAAQVAKLQLDLARAVSSVKEQTEQSAKLDKQMHQMRTELGQEKNAALEQAQNIQKLEDLTSKMKQAESTWRSQETGLAYDLTRARTDLAEQEKMRDRAADELVQLKAKLSHAQSALAQRELEAEEAWSTAKAAKADLARTTEDLTRVSGQQDLRLSELATLAQVVRQGDERLVKTQAQRDELAKKAAETDRLHHEYARLHTETVRLQKETAARQHRINELERQFDAVLSSRFWRMTKPMRALINLVRKNR
jgi:hypothetical protein